MAAEHHPGKIAIPALAVTAYTAKKSKKKKSEEEKKAAVRLENQRRAETRINIGPAYSRWRALRASLGLTLDVQVAVFLLDRAEASPPVCEFVKLPKGQTLRALVKERLAAAAEDTLVLFKRTIAEYEEELRRSKEENQRKQRLLDEVFSPRIELVRGNVQMPSSPGPGLNQDITESPLIKEEPEEQSVKQEEEQLPVAVCDFANMPKGQTLRALVKERLAAAAEDTSVLFERTIAEYEEEQHRSEEENQRKQRLLDKVFNPRIVLVRGNVKIPSSPGSGLNQDITEIPLIKEEPEEQSIKQEEEKPTVSVPESSAVSVKTQVSSLFQTTELREEKRVENKSSEPHFHSENKDTGLSSYTDNDDYREPSSCAAAQMEAEVDGEHVDQVQTRDRSTELSPQNKSAPETTVHSEDASGADGKKLQDSVCKKRNRRKQVFNILSEVHTGQDLSSELHFLSETKGHTELSSDNDNEDDDDWELHMEAEADPVQTKDRSTELSPQNKSETTVHREDASGADGKKLQDSVCKKRFRRNHNLQRDCGVHTGERRVSCPTCGITVARKHLLDLHMRTHTGESPNTCTFCKKTFTQNGDLNAHRRTHAGEEKPYRCSVCEKTFNTNKNRDLHMLMHSGEKPYSCPVCCKAFRRKGGMKLHIATHTEERPYTCALCNKAFKQKTYLNAHIRITHMGEKPHRCSCCEKAFHNRRILKIHMRAHTGEKPYSCLECNKTFAKQSVLNSHKRRHAEEKPYRCSVCEKTFVAKKYLDAHKIIHTGEKPYSCSVCHKAFKRKGDVKSHEITHTGEKPYTCTLCNKAFSHKGSLNTHTRTHTGEKPYSCTICQVKVGTKGNLRSHMKIHTREKPHSCPECNKTFARKGDLNAHVRTHLGDKALQLLSL